MIKSEIDRIFKSTKGRIIVALLFLLPLIDFMQHIYDDIILFGSYNPDNHPVFTSFLSGSSIGHFTQILLSFILPLYFLILYNDSYITDIKSGYFNCLISRTGRKRYYLTKFKISFFVPSLLMFLSLILNLLLCLIVFHPGNAFGGMENFYTDMDNWFIFGYNHPYLYYFIYIISYCLICGLCSILGLCCSILFKNHFVTYPVTFFIWIIQAIIPFGIGSALQPFTEYGLKYFIIGFALFIFSVLIVFIITYFLRLTKDEI